MGYSGRYHAASLAAVFLALAIGILIGIGIAGDVVSSTSEELEASLRSDLDEAEGRIGDLETELGREREAGNTIYPALVNERLSGSSVALIAIGRLPRETAAEVEAALDPSGAEVGAVASLAQPAAVDSLLEQAPPRLASGKRGADRARALGQSVGAGIVGGSDLTSQLRGTLFTSFSGALEDVDRVVFLPSTEAELEGEEQEINDAFYDGLFAGVRRRAAGSVGADRTAIDPASLSAISEAGIATVDHVDLTAGKVALVFSLLGAEGDYGVREDADSFLPELISPAQQP